MMPWDGEVKRLFVLARDHMPSDMEIVDAEAFVGARFPEIWTI